MGEIRESHRSLQYGLGRPQDGELNGKPVTPAEKEAILDAAQRVGYSYSAISAELGIPFQRIHHIIKNYIGAEYREARQANNGEEGTDSKPSQRFADILRVKRPQYADPIKYGKGGKGKWKRAVAYGDSHEPFADKHAMSVVRGIIKDVQPNLVVHVGDLLDCYSISSFDQNPLRRNSLQDEIDQAGGHLHQTAQCAPDAERIYLGGNHEDRLRKLIWKLQGASRELARLRVFQRVMTWPSLLGLEQIGWEYVDYTDQPLVGRLSKLLLKHGDIVRKWSGWSAKGEWEKHAKGGISGHTHRLGAFYHRDMGGSHVWHETGCTCSLKPEYVRHPDWQHACLVIMYTDERFQVEPVYIQDGKALWRAQEFAA